MSTIILYLPKTNLWLRARPWGTDRWHNRAIHMVHRAVKSGSLLWLTTVSNLNLYTAKVLHGLCSKDRLNIRPLCLPLCAPLCDIAIGHWLLTYQLRRSSRSIHKLTSTLFGTMSSHLSSHTVSWWVSQRDIFCDVCTSESSCVYNRTLQWPWSPSVNAYAYSKHASRRPHCHTDCRPACIRKPNALYRLRRLIRFAL